VNRYLFYSLLAAGVVARLVMLGNYELVNGGEVDVYLADEGVVGLMGKHILEGSELPLFFYGQHYLGALEAYCVALSFAVFGVDLFGLRLVPLLFSLALLAVVYRFAYKAYSVAAARWTVALLAVAPVYFLQWNLKARGGFVEHVVLLFVVMVLFWRVFLYHERAPARTFALGLAAGVALWVNQLMLAYVIVMVVLLAMQASDRRGWAMILAGGLLGASLLIGYNVVHPLATARSLARKAVVLNRVPIEQRDESWLLRGVGKRAEALSQGAGKLGLVFGVPPGSGIERLGLDAATREGSRLTTARRFLWFVPAAFFLTALFACRPRRGVVGWDPFGTDQLLGLLALVTFAVGYVSPRYMLPAYPMAAVMAGALMARLGGRSRGLMAAGFASVLVFNLASWADAMQGLGREQRGGDELIAFLEERGISHCYSAGPLYHLVFASGERVVLAPLQKDRYPAYNREVEAADSICYVFRDDQTAKRQHVAMMTFLTDRGVTFGREAVGGYNVLYGFSPREALTGEALRAIRSQEKARIGLGTAGTSR